VTQCSQLRVDSTIPSPIPPCLSTFDWRLTQLSSLYFLLQAHYLPSLLRATLLELLDSPFCPLDLLFNELQATVHGSHCVSFVLFQQNRADELVDVGVIGQGGEFSGDGAVFGELGFEGLAGGDGCLEFCYGGMLGEM
jgi:hypothetical protein